MLLSEVELLAKGEWDALRAVEGATAPLFSLVFLAECGAKLSVLGSSKFFRQRANSYALIVAVLTFIADIVNFVIDGQVADLDGQLNDDNENRFALGIRLLRLPRLMFSLQRSNPFFTSVRALSSFGGLLGLIVVLFTFYGQLGVALFGSRIRTDTFSNATQGSHHGLYLQLIDAEVPSDYAYMNFNDFPSALLTLFYQLMINNWFLTMEVVVHVTGTGWSRAYFLSWYWLAAICMTNLIVAQILQVATKALEKTGGEVASGGGGGGSGAHPQADAPMRDTMCAVRARHGMTAEGTLSPSVAAALRRWANETPEARRWASENAADDVIAGRPPPSSQLPPMLRRRNTSGAVLQSVPPTGLAALADASGSRSPSWFRHAHARIEPSPAVAHTTPTALASGPAPSDEVDTPSPPLESVAASVGSHDL